MGRLFLDSNIFLYAIGGDGPYKAPCQNVLLAVGDGRLDAATSSEVLREILHVRSRRVHEKDGIAATRTAAEIVAEVLPVTEDDVLAACAIIERTPHLSARDALHAAVMKTNGIRKIVSVDRDFDAIKEIRRVAPEQALR